jgi:ribosome-associated toxin RatA of RatAB toxin-antitoxin module
VKTVDERRVAAPADRVFRVAREVERWPDILPHYRFVRVLERSAERDIVEMSANRPFGLFQWPTWWTSEMRADPDRREVRYRHIRGITRGMDVIWRIVPDGTGSHVSIVHDWDGPRWPLISKVAADWVIGPVFIHGIASRTLAGIARHVESTLLRE